MSPDTEQIFQTALALPAGEQVELIEALIAELDQADQQPLDEKWMEEIRRRSAAYDAGQVTPITWSVVRERARGGDKPHGCCPSFPCGGGRLASCPCLVSSAQPPCGDPLRCHRQRCLEAHSGQPGFVRLDR